MPRSSATRSDDAVPAAPAPTAAQLSVGRARRDWIKANASPPTNLGAALFCRLYGCCIIYFAHYTVPDYLHFLEHTTLVFPYSPWHRLPLIPIQNHLETLRQILLLSGGLLAVGVLPRIATLINLVLIGYFAQLDRTFYNNHYILMVQISFLLVLLDRRCVAWPWSGTAALPRWQLTYLRGLLLTPYAFGALAKLNYSWLLHSQPVLSWADNMLGELDTATNGLLSHYVDTYLPTDTDIVQPFSRVVCYSGLVFDAWLPYALLTSSTQSSRSVFTHTIAIVLCVLFNAMNKLWFGLGVFPYLNLCALLLFVERDSSSPQQDGGGEASPKKRPFGSRSSHTTTTIDEQWSFSRVLLTLLAIPHLLIPLRGYLWYSYDQSGLWTDEGHLYAWHMKLVEREGTLVLTVRGRVQDAASQDDQVEEDGDAMDDGDGSWRTWSLVPELDTALHTDQRGELPHNPSMLLTYSSTHLLPLFKQRGITNISIHASYSCVSVNGRTPQPLYMPSANLLEYAEEYNRVRADWSGYSGVGRFLHPWRSAGYANAVKSIAWSKGGGAAEALCNLREPPESRIALDSDTTYRWLYGPLLFSRQEKRDWPWVGRSRLPLLRPAEVKGDYDAAEDTPAVMAAAVRADKDVPPWADYRGSVVGVDVRMPPPLWVTACSYLHAAQSMWCPEDAPADDDDDDGAQALR